MAEYDYDLFVIGGGSGGVRASRMAAGYGKKVAIAEEYGFGGTCVIRGCIPKKLFVYASEYGEDFADAIGFGWTVPEHRFDWKMLVANKDKEIARLEGLYKQNVDKAGVEIFMERAELLDDHTIHLKTSDRKFTAATILVATGGRPSRDMGACVGAEHAITSNEAFHLEKLPHRIVVAGGGYIAVEFANIFHGLGCEVTLVYRGPKILRGFDEDMRDALTDAMNKKGIRIVCNRIFRKVDKVADELCLITDHNEMLETDALMLAIGRVPNTDGMGLGQGRREHSASAARWWWTNSRRPMSITSMPSAMSPTAWRSRRSPSMRRCVSSPRSMAASPRRSITPCIPTGVFSQPEIGTVGMTEAQALANGHTIDVYKSNFKPLKHTMSGREVRALFKLIVDAKTGKILGCHIFTPDTAAEITQTRRRGHEDGRHQGRFRHHHRAASLGGRGTGHHAHQVLFQGARLTFTL